MANEIEKKTDKDKKERGGVMKKIVKDKKKKEEEKIGKLKINNQIIKDMEINLVLMEIRDMDMEISLEHMENKVDMEINLVHMETNGDMEINLALMEIMGIGLVLMDIKDMEVVIRDILVQALKDMGDTDLMEIEVGNRLLI